MRTKLNKLLGVATVLATLAGAPALYAHAAAEDQETSGGMMQGGMMQGGQGGMMGMMQQMSQMMETCNEMMQGMAEHHGSGAPEIGDAPEEQE